MYQSVSCNQILPLFLRFFY